MASTTQLLTLSVLLFAAVAQSFFQPIPYTNYQTSLTDLFKHRHWNSYGNSPSSSYSAPSRGVPFPHPASHPVGNPYGGFTPKESPGALFNDVSPKYPYYAPTLQPGNYCGKTFWAASQCTLPCYSRSSIGCPVGTFCFPNVLCGHDLLFHPQSPSPTPRPKILHRDYWCGHTYWDAFQCVQACPSGDGRTCPHGMMCFAGVEECFQPVTPTPTSSTTPTATPTVSTTATATATPTPTPTRTPTPSPTPSPRADAMVQGYYQKTWTDFTGFQASNFVICESPTVDVKSALQHCHGFYSFLNGQRFISFGSYLTFKKSDFDEIDQAIKDGVFFGYQGIAYHLFTMEGGMEWRFEQSLMTAKQYGLKTFVTFQTSAPRFIIPTTNVMKIILGSPHVDFVSPRFWEDGDTPDYRPQKSFPWSEWFKCNNSVVSSVLSSQYYEDSVRFLQQYGITPIGWVKWN